MRPARHPGSGACPLTPPHIGARTTAAPPVLPRGPRHRPMVDTTHAAIHATVGKVKYLMRNRDSAHADVSPRPRNPSTTIVASAEGYTYAAKVWPLSINQGPFSAAPCQTLSSVLNKSHVRCRSVGVLTCSSSMASS